MKDFLILTFQGIAAFAALSAVIVTLLLNWNRLRKNSIFKPISSFNQKASIFTTISRRTFLIVGTLTTGVVFWALIHFRLTEKKLKNIYNRLFQVDKGLIINKKTGIIHHKNICSDHLPIDKNVSDSNYHYSKIRCHKSKKVPILDLIAQTRSAEAAIEILLLAAEGNPTSVHIYDKLIKLLGKIKRYESIYLLLRNVEDELRQALSEKKSGTKDYKKHQKALRHVQMQKEKVLSNARIRAVSS